MKKDKPSYKHGRIAGIRYGIAYFPDDDNMERNIEINCGLFPIGESIVIFSCDAPKLRKFIKTLKKGLRRLERV